MKIKNADWCKLCMELEVSPDSPIEFVIKKARKIQELKREYSKRLFKILEYARGVIK